MLTNPGVTKQPAAFMTVQPVAGKSGPTATIRPSRIKTSPDGTARRMSSIVSTKSAF